MARARGRATGCSWNSELSTCGPARAAGPKNPLSVMVLLMAPAGISPAAADSLRDQVAEPPTSYDKMVVNRAYWITGGVVAAAALVWGLAVSRTPQGQPAGTPLGEET